MVTFLAHTIRITPWVFLRMLPAYAVFLFALYFVYGREMDPVVRWFLALATISPSMSFLVLIALRSGLVQLKVSAPIHPPAIFKGLGRLAGFQWAILMIVQLVIYAPMIWALETYGGLPLTTNWMLTLVGLRDFVISNNTDSIHPAFGYAIMAYAIPYGISAAILGTAMAGTAATVVRKPPRIDAFWGFGHRWFSLLLLYVPVAFILWGGVVIAYQEGISQYFFQLVPSSILAAILPIYLVNFLWLPIFAAGASVAYAQNQQRIEEQRQAELDEMIAGAQPMPDLKALRQARQERQSTGRGF
ncbi:MAG: hypothetical protein AAFQ36_11895 [Pseudomonadota bacterium]